MLITIPVMRGFYCSVLVTFFLFVCDFAVGNVQRVSR